MIVVVNRTSHGLHLLMTLLTGGLWIPVWIWRARANRVLVAGPSVVVNNSVTASNATGGVPEIPRPRPPSDDDPMFKMT